ncbi:hypothetical protein F5888DRAFT_1669163 [Russula emetica]|nr:hypothetical protein F5888DRAFT_1669163 [Russula emetica]
MDEILACLVVVAIFSVVCRLIISCCRQNNDEYDYGHPILVSSSRNVSYTQGFYAPVKSTPTIPSYNDQRSYSRPFQPSSSHNIPDIRNSYVPTKPTVKTLTIPEHGRNVSSSTSRIPPPREGPSSIRVLSNVLLSEEGENVPVEEDLREKARRMKREMQEALNLAKQARKRRDFRAEAKHKQAARVRECTMERLNKEAATTIFNQKNKGLPNGTVDLHGLFVNEALEHAKQEFQSVVFRSNKVVRFIVGKGKHTKDGQLKIRPAVEKLCKERGFTYHLDPNNSGILVVQC